MLNFCLPEEKALKKKNHRSFGAIFPVSAITLFLRIRDSQDTVLSSMLQASRLFSPLLSGLIPPTGTHTHITRTLVIQFSASIHSPLLVNNFTVFPKNNSHIIFVGFKGPFWWWRKERQKERKERERREGGREARKERGRERELCTLSLPILPQTFCAHSH